MSANLDHTVAIVVDAAGKHRAYPHADDYGNSRLWGAGDPDGRHRMYWYLEGVTAERALELAAYRAAALCIDFTALEVTPQL
jgi:hypothetical protein